MTEHISKQNENKITSPKTDSISKLLLSLRQYDDQLTKSKPNKIRKKKQTYFDFIAHKMKCTN